MNNVNIDTRIEIIFNKNIEFSDRFKKNTNELDGLTYSYISTNTSNRITLTSEFGIIISLILEICYNKLIIKPAYKLDYNTKYNCIFFKSNFC